MSPCDPFCHNSHKPWLNDQSMITGSSLLNQNLSPSSRLQQALTAQDKTTLKEDVNMVLKQIKKQQQTVWNIHIHW